MLARLCVGLLGLFLLLGVPCFAVELDVRAGFDDAYVVGRWNTIFVTATNDSDRPVRGVLHLVPPRRDLGWNTYSVPVDLPASSRKLYELNVDAYSWGNDRLKVELACEDGQAFQKECQIRRITPPEMVLLACGDSSAGLAHLGGTKLAALPGAPGGPGGGPPTLRCELLEPAAMPSSSLGLDAATMIVLSPTAQGLLGPDTLEAIRKWTANGGLLVLSGGSDYKALDSPFYRRLLPMNITGVRDIADPAGLRRMYGGQMIQAPLTVCEGGIKPGVGARILCYEAGKPLVVARGYGTGAVVFLTFDYTRAPFKGWDGQPAFWKELIAGVKQQSPVVARLEPSMDPDAVADLQTHTLAKQFPSVTPPSVKTIAGFLLAYLFCLVPANYVFLSRRKRLEYAWVTIPIIVLVFTIVVYTTGFRLRGGSLLLNMVQVAETCGGSDAARATVDLSIFSPGNRDYQIALPDDQAIIYEPGVRPYDSRRSPLSFVQDGGMSVRDFRVNMWVSRTLAAETGADLGGAITSNLRIEKNLPIGVIRNGTKFPLRNCRLLYRNLGARLGDIPAGGTAKVAAGNYNKVSNVVIPDDLPLDEHVYRQAIWYARGLSRGNSLTLVAATDRPILNVRIPARGAKRLEANLIICRLSPDLGL